MALDPRLGRRTPPAAGPQMGPRTRFEEVWLHSLEALEFGELDLSSLVSWAAGFELSEVRIQCKNDGFSKDLANLNAFGEAFKIVAVVWGTGVVDNLKKKTLDLSGNWGGPTSEKE